MELLNKFDQQEVDFIIKNGIVLFENSKKYFKNNSMSIDDYKQSEHAFILSEKEENIKQLRNTIQEYETRGHILQQKYDESRREDKTYFLQQIDELKQEKRQLLNLFQINVQDKVNVEMSRFKTELDEKDKVIMDLKKQNKQYFDLYESKEKGMNFENELYPKLLEYNDKQLNSVWNITHVGQVLSEKTDFHFQHKLLNVIILVDTKNNIVNNPVNNTSIEKFERDICSEKTNSIGGILLAKEKICKKKNFEINKIKDKYAFYVANFTLNNVSYIFSLLDQMLELHHTKSDNNMIENRLKDVYIENYKLEKTRFDKLERERKESSSRLNSIVFDFRDVFDEDIDFVLSSKGIKDSQHYYHQQQQHQPQHDYHNKSKGEKKSSNQQYQQQQNQSAIIDYEELEHDKKIMNKVTNNETTYRTKYYLCFKDAKGEKCIQYFKNNYAKNQKLLKLQNSNKSGDKNVITF